MSTIACAAATASIFSGFAIFSAMPRAAAVGVELHLAAEEIVRIEPAEHHVGVGDGRLGAAAAVADRAGIGARALRADLERADRRRSRRSLPPPAPTSTTSIIGSITGWPLA